MKCPNCHHVSDKALLECSDCGEVFDRELLETSQSAEFLLKWLEQKRDEGFLGTTVHNRLQKIARKELADINAMLLPELRDEEILTSQDVKELEKLRLLVENNLSNVSDWVEEGLVDMASGVSLNQFLEEQLEELKNKLGRNQIPVDYPTELEIIDFALDSLEDWEENAGLAYSRKLKNELNHRRSEILYPPIVEAKTSPRSLPATEKAIQEQDASVSIPPRPERIVVEKREPINWGKAWESIVGAFVSGAVMRGILYLGAFMIVVSAGILVGRGWDTFSPLLQLVFLFSVPAIFYFAGWIVRTRLELELAGGALTGIGALLLAADFGAIFQFGDQPLEPKIYWLVASLISTAVYTLNARQEKSQFFGYLTALGATSITMALTALAGFGFTWILTSTSVSSTGIILFAARLGKIDEKWRGVVLAYRRITQLLFPLIVLFLLLVYTDSTWALTFSLGLASVFYAVNAFNFPSPIFGHASVWSTVIFGVFLLVSLSVPIEWFAIIFSVISPIFMMAANALTKRLSNSIEFKQQYVTSVRNAGFLWTFSAPILSLLNISEHFWISTLSLVLVTANLAWWSLQFNRPIYMLLSGLLFVMPFSLATGRLINDSGIVAVKIWILALWTILGFVYLWFGMRLKKYPDSAAWIFSISQSLALAAIIGFFTFFRRGPDELSAQIVLLSVSVLIFLGSFFIQRGKKHPSISFPISWIAKKHRAGGYLWPLGSVVPVLLWLLMDAQSPNILAEWTGVSLSLLAIIYLAAGQRMGRLLDEYRLPTHTLAYPISVISIVLSLGYQWALITNLFVVVAVLVGYSFIYRRIFDISLAGLLFIWPFQLLLNQSPIPIHAHSLAFAALSSFVYLAIAFRIYSSSRHKALPIFFLAHLVAGYSILTSMLGAVGLYTQNIALVAFLTPLLISVVQIYNLFKFKQTAYAWSSIVLLTLALGQGLVFFEVNPDYSSSAWMIFAVILVISERRIDWVFKGKKRSWPNLIQSPMRVASFLYASFGLALTSSTVIRSLIGSSPAEYHPTLWAHGLFIGLLALTARIYQKRWPTYIEPIFALIPVTMFFDGFGKSIFGFEITLADYGLIWSGLSLLHFIPAALLDNRKTRYSHGLFFGTYFLSALAIVWTIFNPSILILTLGFGILLMVFSAALHENSIHFSLKDLVSRMFGKGKSKFRSAFNDVFIWIAAWVFPLWTILLLNRFDALRDDISTGLTISGLLLLVVGIIRTRRKKSSLPIISSAHFYALIGLVITIPATWSGLSKFVSFEDNLALSLIATQTLLSVFYILSSWHHAKRLLAHAASWIAIFPITIAGLSFSEEIMRITLSKSQFALVWGVTATILIAIGIAIDKQKIRYAHGPYFAGYLLGAFALVWSISDQLVNIYTLTLLIPVWIGSQILVFKGSHRSFQDFAAFIWRAPNTLAQRFSQTGFLTLASIAFPFLLAQVLAYNDIELAKRGLALVVTAPIYIALGLILNRIKAEFTWSIYGVGYLLTAVGAMVAFEDPTITIYVLSINSIVYAFSAYNFKQAFWLYLSNSLIPIIALLIIYERLQEIHPVWASGTFMALAFIYGILGQFLDRRAHKLRQDESFIPFAIPFYTLTYLLSAISIALASAGGNNNFAITIYLVGVLLYGLSAWLFKESIFIYPAAWLLAVPYYLLISTSGLDPNLTGISWLPLILSYILIGRLVFQKDKIHLRKLGDLIPTLEQPSTPFYLLAYALSISMIVLSRENAATFSLSFALAALVYFGSSALVRRSLWLYPALLASHLAILSFFAINPFSATTILISVSFLGVTWITSMFGYFFSRKFPVDFGSSSSRKRFKILRWDVEFGDWPFLGYLLAPSWAKPFFLFSAIDILLWQGVAFFNQDTAIVMAGGFTLLLAIFTMLWRDRGLAFGSLTFILLAGWMQLIASGLGGAEAFSWLTALGFILFISSLLTERLINGLSVDRLNLEVWIQPLSQMSVYVSGVGVLFSLAAISSDPRFTAVALGFSGSIYVAKAYKDQVYLLGYLGMGMLLGSWTILLLGQGVSEPQWYAIPAGLYFTGIGFLERRRDRRLFALLVESFGIALLLVTSFVQSINGAEGFPYFLLLLAEGLLVLWWATIQRLRIPFLIGLGGSALNVVAQIFVSINVYESQRWFIILGVGLTLVIAVVFIEREREIFIRRVSEWRDQIWSWD